VYDVYVYVVVGKCVNRAHDPVCSMTSTYVCNTVGVCTSFTYIRLWSQDTFPKKGGSINYTKHYTIRHTAVQSRVEVLPGHVHKITYYVKVCRKISPYVT